MTDSSANVIGGGQMSGSTSTSTSQGTSTPQVLNTPQSDYSLAFAREAQNAGSQLYGWAGKQYKYLQGLAGTAIPQFLQSGANASAMGNQQFNQYMNTYAPAMERFNEMANSYASPARQQYAMGQAEAGATQDANAAWQNTQKDLQSYGIDPSSGMYAGLKSAAQTAAGASAAGAANQARQGVENTGIGLQEQNINFGQSLPASALNAVNAQNTALSGAVNTGESTVNTGANAYNNANNFYQTAQQVKLPVSGEQSQNTSLSNSASMSSTPTIHGGNLGSNSLLAHGGVVPPDDSYRRGGHVRRPHGGGRGGGGAASGATGTPVPRSNMTAEPDGTFSNHGSWDDFGASPSPSPSPPAPQQERDPISEGRARGGGGGGHRGGGRQGGGRPMPQQQPQFQPQQTSIPDSGIPDGSSLANGLPDDSMGAAQGGPMDLKMARPPGHFGRPHPPHPYHMNGLPDASTGGHVPYELSPSHGHTTDDVVANLNAGEFVVPRRTVHHVGHKFLYDLIGKSDKEMGLHPQPVGPSKVAPNSGAGKARQAAESQNSSSGGLPA